MANISTKKDIKRTCGTMQVHERLLRTVPGYREARDASENYAFRAMMWPQAIGRTGCIKIPVVVHVVYKTATQNISDAQIKSQILVLTDDFRKRNTDVSTVPAPFAPLVGDARIEFELATVDPSGNPTSGITRTATNNVSFTDDDAVKSVARGGEDPWPCDKYLNIWVCQLAGGLLGYAQFPGGPAATDGVVILHSAFGTTGTAAAPFNLGRSATHEVGHWLNLRHIWGDDGTGCWGDDFVADTPNQGGPNYDTPTFPSVSCGNGPNGDMFMNYMDYVDDPVMVMFTAGQVTRIQATLDSTRSTIGTAIPCGKLAKELPKDVIKEWAKEPIKEMPKDPPKEWAKDPPKDLPKDWAKDPAFEPVKIANDQLQPPWGPITQPGNVVIPFVLATGAAVQLTPQISMRQQTASLANAYLKLLTQYGKLYSAGQLDAAGITAWQETAAEYQRLLALSS